MTSKSRMLLLEQKDGTRRRKLSDLAHHTNIGTWNLSKRLHLNKAGIRTFAKTVKDVTPSCKPNSLVHTAAAHRSYRPPRYQKRKLENWTSLQCHTPAVLHPPTPLPIPYPTLLPHPATEDPPSPTITYASMMNNPTPFLPTKPMSELGQIKEMLHSLFNRLLQTQGTDIS